MFTLDHLFTTLIFIHFQIVSLHILAFVLQNLPASFLDQALKPFPRVSLKDDPTPSVTPRNLGGSGIYNTN